MLPRLPTPNKRAAATLRLHCRVRTRFCADAYADSSLMTELGLFFMLVSPIVTHAALLLLGGRACVRVYEHQQM
jgi:hypothetical protein